MTIGRAPWRGSFRRAPRGERKLASGFGLLEAIVALTILAVSGAALFDWIGQNLETATRLKQNEARAKQVLMAEAVISAINPFLEPTGQRRDGQVVISWTSELLAPIRPSRPFDLTERLRWNVGLYRLKVTITNADPPLSDSFEVTQVGLEEVGVKSKASQLDAP